MAYWNGKQIVYAKPKPCLSYPDWEYVDCGCSGGLSWGGEYPRECPTCKGGGAYCKHIKSGVLAIYPGGPFLGREPVEDTSDE